jgi:hypothetical protein
MQRVSDQDLAQEVVAILKAVSGRRSIGPDQMIGRDVGIYGLDGIEVVEELEKKFDIDFKPLIEAHTISRRRTWIDRLLGKGHPYADLTVRELIDYIAGERRRREI